MSQIPEARYRKSFHSRVGGSPLTSEQMPSRLAIAPTPLSPHTKTLLIGGTTRTPQASIVWTWPAVQGCSHLRKKSKRELIIRQ